MRINTHPISHVSGVKHGFMRQSAGGLVAVDDVDFLSDQDCPEVNDTTFQAILLTAIMLSIEY